MQKSDILSCLKRLVALLVNDDIQQIVALTQNGRLSADEISIAISDYPGRLSMPPRMAADIALMPV